MEKDSYLIVNVDEQVGIIENNKFIPFEDDLFQIIEEEGFLNTEVSAEAHDFSIYKDKNLNLIVEAKFIVCPYNSDVNSDNDYFCNCDENRRDICSKDI